MARLLGSGTRSRDSVTRKTASAIGCVVLVLAAVPFVRADDLSEQTQILEAPAPPAKGTGREGFPPPGDWRDGIRFQLEGQYAPEAEMSGAKVSLFRGLGRLRLRAPITDRTRLQFSATVAPSHYDITDSEELFSDCPSCPEPHEFQEGSLVLLGGYLLNPKTHLIRPGERWAAIAGAITRVRWETGALGDSATYGGSLGIGYEIPDRLRLGLGMRVETKLDGGVSISPDGHFRWDITDNLRVRDRSLGLHFDYRRGGRFEYSVAGYRTSDQFLLDDDPGRPKDLTFDDRRTVVTGGLEWKASHHLRLRAEAGAIVERRLRYESDGDELDSVSGDPSPYVTLRVELRP